MKYVIVSVFVSPGVKRNFHAIFPEFLTHSIMAKALCQAAQKETGQPATIVSGGRCFFVNAYYCDVESGSESMGVAKGSRDTEDHRILNLPSAYNGLEY